MSTNPDPVAHRQIPVIKKIIQDETWLEGERRGSPVSPEDPAVREHVCDIVLRIGQNLRDTLASEIEKSSDRAGASTETDSRAA